VQRRKVFAEDARELPFGVRRSSHAVTFAAFSFGDTARSAFAGSWCGVQEKRSSKIPLLWRGAPIWSAAIRERSDLCRFFFGDTARQRIRRELARGSGKAIFKNSPPLEGCPVGAGWFETPSHSNHPVLLRSPPLRRRAIWSAAIRERSDLCRFYIRRYRPQAIRRELVWVSGKAFFKNSPPLEGCPVGAGWSETPSHSTPSRFARPPSEGEEFLEKRRETRRLPEPPLRRRGIS